MDTGRTLWTCGRGRLWAIVKLVLPRCCGSKVEIQLGTSMFSRTMFVSLWNTIHLARSGCIFGYYVTDMATVS